MPSFFSCLSQCCLFSLRITTGFDWWPLRFIIQWIGGEINFLSNGCFRIKHKTLDISDYWKRSFYCDVVFLIVDIFLFSFCFFFAERHVIFKICLCQNSVSWLFYSWIRESFKEMIPWKTDTKTKTVSRLRNNRRIYKTSNGSLKE